MKDYKDYMDSFSASAELQSKTISRLRGAASERYDTKNRNVRDRRLMRAIPVWARVACTAVLVCAVLTATAYAVYSYVTWVQAENADPGGSFIMEPINEAEYNTYLESSGTITSSTVYRHDFKNQHVVDERTMQAIEEYLTGMVFTADGDAFELFVPVSGGFQADDRGNVLYDKDGRAIGDISYERIGAGDLIGIRILPIEEVDKWFEFSDTYDEAVAFLGKDFRLPTIYTDGFGPPTFRVNGDESLVELLGRRAVYISLDGDPGMYFFVEVNRDTGDDAWSWYTPDSIVTEGEIAGVSVYKIINEESNRYTWSLDGLTYMFFQFKSHPIYNNSFTDEQCEEIIMSMIE